MAAVALSVMPAASIVVTSAVLHATTASPATRFRHRTAATMRFAATGVHRFQGITAAAATAATRAAMAAAEVMAAVAIAPVVPVATPIASGLNATFETGGEGGCGATTGQKRVSWKRVSLLRAADATRRGGKDPLARNSPCPSMRVRSLTGEYHGSGLEPGEPGLIRFRVSPC